MNRPSIPTTAIWLVKLAVTGGLLTWLFSREDVRLGFHTAAFTRPVWLFAAFACGGASVFFMAWRWSACLQACGCRLPFGMTLRISLAANAVGLFSVGALGVDAIRVALGGRILPNKKGALVTSAILDHASGLPVLFLMGLALLATAGMAPGAGGGILITLGIAFSSMMIFGIILRVFHREWHDRILSYVTQRVMAAGTRVAALLSVPVLFFHYGIFWCVGMALPMNAPAPGMLGAIALADAAASLPISIAGLGVREKSFETLLSLWYGIAPAVAVKVSLTGLAVLALWATAGAVCLLAFRAKRLPEP